MQLPGVNASSFVYLLFAYHVEGAVEAWSEVEIITAEQRDAVAAVGALITPLIVGLRAAVQASDDADRAAQKALARFRVRDVVLDMRIMGVSDALLNGPAMRSRQSPVYIQVFGGDNAGDLTRARMREEPEIATLLLGRLDKVADFDGKAAARTPLSEAITKSMSARDAMDAADLAENQAGDAELGARLALRLGMEKAYGMLRTAFPGRRDFVESFFPKVERAAAKDASATPDPDAKPGAGEGSSNPAGG